MEDINCLIVENNINRLIRDMIIKDGDNIPNWLLLEVLIRLPLKSIFRCKLVSKQWLSIILDPYFVRLYCSLVQHHRRWAIFGILMTLNGSETPHFLDYDESSSKHASCFYPFPRTVPKMHWINGESNGLLLYKFIKDNFSYSIRPLNFRICNPATGQWLALPPHEEHRVGHRVEMGFVANVEDGVLLSFIVVRMHETDGHTSNLTKCQVYFSDIGEWKMYNVHIDGIIPVEIKFTGSGHRSPTVLNGIIYWILRANVLLAYDPSKSPDQARIIALPPSERARCFWDTDMCSAYQGQLRYFRATYLSVFMTSQNLDFKIWVMNESEDWCLQHKGNPVDIINDFDSSWGRRVLRCPLLPMSFHPYDSDVVFLRDQHTMLSYNIKTIRLQVEENFTNDPRGSIESDGGRENFMLVLPPWPISISLSECERRGLISDKLNY